MLEEISEIKGLEVYAPNGLFIGYADKYVLNLSDKKVTGIFVQSASPVLVDENTSIKIPYRWVQSIGDIIILNKFPKYVHSNGVTE